MTLEGSSCIKVPAALLAGILFNAAELAGILFNATEQAGTVFLVAVMTGSCSMPKNWPGPVSLSQ